MHHIKWMQHIDFSTFFPPLQKQAGINWNCAVGRFLKVFKMAIDNDPPLFLEGDITPYIHLFTMHMADMIANFGSLKKLSCSSLERQHQRQHHRYLRQTTKGGFHQESDLQLILIEMCILFEF